MTGKIRVGALAVAAAIIATGLAACGTETLSDDDVAKEMRQDVLAPRGIKGTVKCPKETKAEKDKKVKCTVRDSEGNKGSITATVENEDGDLRFKPAVNDLQLSVIEKNAADAGRSKGVKSKVSCIPGTEPKKGAIYYCTANIRGSGRGVLKLTQEDASSEVNVRIQRRKLRTRRIEASIKRELRKQGVSAKVSCPARVTSQKGSKFSCRLKGANGRTLTVIATQTDEEGNFNLKVRR